ncbi:MAG: RNA polymerase sigma factor, partial [Myxococcota bacterium]
MTSDPTAVEVLAKLDAGDVRGAAAWLVRGYGRDVYQLCATYAAEAAEDLTQEAFSKALVSLKTFRREASPRTWLLRIARNHCIDYLRAAKRRLDDPAEEPDGQVDDAPLPHDLLSRRWEVERALAELSENDRAMILLRFRNGFAYDEIAEVFGVRSGAIRMRVSRALGRMRLALEAPEASAAMVVDEFASSGAELEDAEFDGLSLAEGGEDAAFAGAEDEPLAAGAAVEDAAFAEEAEFADEAVAAAAHPLETFFAAVEAPLSERLGRR